MLYLLMIGGFVLICFGYVDEGTACVLGSLLMKLVVYLFKEVM